MQAFTSDIILGTVQFGMNYGISNASGQTPESEVFSVLDLARKSGIQILDTAEAYGNAQDVIGKYHQGHPKFGIITKFIAGEKPLRQTVEDMIRRLKVEKLFAVFFHRFSDYTDNPNLADELFQLKKDGLIIHTGISLYANQEVSYVSADPRIDILQVPFNCFDNYALRAEVFSRARKAGKVIHARSAFLQGLFFMRPEDLIGKMAPLKKYLAHFHNLGEEYEISAGELALRYAISCCHGKNKILDNIVLGVNNTAQLQKNLNYAATLLPQEIVEKINAIKIAETELLNPSNWK